MVRMEIFDKEIESLANEFLQKFGISDDNVEINNKALKNLRDIVENGAEKFNKTSRSEVLNVHDIPKGVVSLFFIFDVFEKAFLFNTQRKQIFFIAADSKTIYIFGMDSKLEVKAKTPNKITQLLRLSYEMNGDEVKYFDNSNMEIDPYDVVLQVVKWGLS